MHDAQNFSIIDMYDTQNFVCCKMAHHDGQSLRKRDTRPFHLDKPLWRRVRAELRHLGGIVSFHQRNHRRTNLVDRQTAPWIKMLPNYALDRLRSIRCLVPWQPLHAIGFRTTFYLDNALPHNFVARMQRSRNHHGYPSTMHCQ